jgi:hypothetical protein
MFGFTSESGMAQYTDEFIICTDGRSPDTCRDTEVLPDEDGIVVWGRREYGNTLCVGVGFEPQDTDCSFTGASYRGFDCRTTQNPSFARRVPAGDDMAVACGLISPLPNGNYSARATRNSCFDDKPICGNFVLVDTVPE